MSRAIIIGYSGQDGTILSNKLKLLNFEVLGITKDKTYSTLKEYDQKVLNISSKADIYNIIKNFKPNQVYYLAAFQSSSAQIIDDEDPNNLKNSFEVNVFSLQYFLEGVYLFSRDTVVFYAASSHIYGDTKTLIQNEETDFSPIDYYGISKVSGINLCKYYREKKSLSIAVGIMYNHESIYRKESFVSIHIIKSAFDILNGDKKHLHIGNLDAKVDWGSAYDYVDAMITLLNKQLSGNFIIATGKQHSVREFVQIVFDQLGLDFEKHVIGANNVNHKKRNNLCGDSSKLQKMTGWSKKTSFYEMITDMVDFFRENNSVRR